MISNSAIAILKKLKAIRPNHFLFQQETRKTGKNSSLPGFLRAFRLSRYHQNDVSIRLILSILSKNL